MRPKSVICCESCMHWALEAIVVINCMRKTNAFAFACMMRRHFELAAKAIVSAHKRVQHTNTHTQRATTKHSTPDHLSSWSHIYCIFSFISFQFDLLEMQWARSPLNVQQHMKNNEFHKSRFCCCRQWQRRRQRHRRWATKEINMYEKYHE